MFSAVVFLTCSISFAADNTTNNVDSKLESGSPPKTLSQSSIISAANSVKNFANKNKKLPDSVTISGYKFSMPEFDYLLSKTIAKRYKKSKSDLTVKYNIKNPSKPSGTNIKTRIFSKNYYDFAVRNYKFMDKNNQAPNYISHTKGSKIQYQSSIFLFSSVLSYLNSKKKLPSYVDVNIKKSQGINKYIPNYLRDAQFKKVSNNNAIWIQSKSFYSVNFKTLANSGIKNVFLHEFAFTKYGNTTVNNWIKSANNQGIKVHIWIQAFYENGKWVNPVDTKTKTYNQSLFNNILSKIRTYSKMSRVSGIHLDYLRYPGTAYKYNYSNGVSGEKAVTEFTRQAAKVMNSINSRLILSAAVMPETNSNAYYYGQNIPSLGKYLDVIIPMIYKGNYRKDSAWITATTSWFVNNSGGAKVWGGIQTYKSDNKPDLLSIPELKTDSYAVMEGGAAGIALFRWGLTNFFDFLSIK
ncbi:MAG: hypothetical protein FWH54_03570 [Methanobrevibacter sp.]|nr:hypothetical protein [Methanobrevibacter sp.]